MISLYYYYPGLPKDRKESDIENLIKFIKESSEHIYSLVLDDRINKGFFKVFEEDERNNFQLKEWVEDVKINIAKELRDLEIILYTRKGLKKLWSNLDKVGLTSIQLESKLNFWSKLFEKIRDWVSGKIKDISDLNIFNLKNALKATGIILQSLMKILLGFEPLSELKDFFELSLDML